MTHIPKCACAKCGLQMQVTVGKKVLVTCAIGSYYTIYADQYTCPECGAQVLAQWADKPMTQAWEELKKEEASADLVVDLGPQKFRTPYHVRRAHAWRVLGTASETGRTRLKKSNITEVERPLSDIHWNSPCGYCGKPWREPASPDCPSGGHPAEAQK